MTVSPTTERQALIDELVADGVPADEAMDAAALVETELVAWAVAWDQLASETEAELIDWAALWDAAARAAGNAAA